MELIAFVFTGGWKDDAIRFHKLLKARFKGIYTMKQLQCKIKTYEDRTEVRMKPLQGLNQEWIVKKVSIAVAEYTVQYLEPYFIRKCIRSIGTEEGEEESKEIEKYALHLLERGMTEDQPQTYMQRMMKLAEEVEPYLLQFRTIHVLGFIRFRMKKYLQQLQDVVEFAMDEYIMERQYQNFINLLRCFVQTQEPKVPLVHLVHKGNYEFVLLDEELQPIRSNPVESLVVEMLDHELNYEDMIVSTLINVSPQMIYIHTEESDLQVIKTIQSIFEDRTVLCLEDSIDKYFAKPLQLR